MTSSQEIRADGWQHDYAAQLRVAAGLARENRRLRERVAELEAALDARARLSERRTRPGDAALVSADG